MDRGAMQTFKAKLVTETPAVDREKPLAFHFSWADFLPLPEAHLENPLPKKPSQSLHVIQESREEKDEKVFPSSRKMQVIMKKQSSIPDKASLVDGRRKEHVLQELCSLLTQVVPPVHCLRGARTIHLVQARSHLSKLNFLTKVVKMGKFFALPEAETRVSTVSMVMDSLPPVLESPNADDKGFFKHRPRARPTCLEAWPAAQIMTQIRMKKQPALVDGKEKASQVTPALPVHVNRHLHDLVAEALGDVGRVAESQGHMEKLVYMEKLQDWATSTSRGHATDLRLSLPSLAVSVFQGPASRSKSLHRCFAAQLKSPTTLVLPATAMSGAQLCGRWASRAERAERRAGAVGAVVRAETTVEAGDLGWRSDTADVVGLDPENRLTLVVMVMALFGILTDDDRTGSGTPGLQILRPPRQEELDCVPDVRKVLLKLRLEGSKDSKLCKSRLAGLRFRASASVKMDTTGPPTASWEVKGGFHLSARWMERAEAPKPRLPELKSLNITVAGLPLLRALHDLTAKRIGDMPARSGARSPMPSFPARPLKGKLLATALAFHLSSVKLNQTKSWADTSTERWVACEPKRRRAVQAMIQSVSLAVTVVKRHQPLEYEVYMEKLIYLEKLQELATMNSRTTALLCATLSVPVEIAAGMGLSVPVVVNKISKGQRPAKPSIFHPSADFVTLKQHAPLVLKRSRRRVIGEPVTVAVKAVISAMVPPIQDARRELRALGALGGSFRTALVGADQPVCEAVGAVSAAQALAALNDTWQPPPVKDSPEAPRLEWRPVEQIRSIRVRSNVGDARRRRRTLRDGRKRYSLGAEPRPAARAAHDPSSSVRRVNWREKAKELKLAKKRGQLTFALFGGGGYFEKKRRMSFDCAESGTLPWVEAVYPHLGLSTPCAGEQMAMVSPFASQLVATGPILEEGTEITSALRAMWARWSSSPFPTGGHIGLNLAMSLERVCRPIRAVVLFDFISDLITLYLPEGLDILVAGSITQPLPTPFFQSEHHILQVGTCYWPEEARVDPLQNRSSVAANLQLYSRRDATRVSYAGAKGAVARGAGGRGGRRRETKLDPQAEGWDGPKELETRGDVHGHPKSVVKIEDGFQELQELDLIW
ncbi:unnamed protein product [Durusdinium trenchii]|uniref:Uncharacterized protein n=1 Tax=Durusdinium trenchii TaxID=1381693 RepID=A0ABP0LJ20_9DINO